MRNIGIICPCFQEAKPLIEYLNQCEKRIIDKTPFYIGKIEEVTAVLCNCGVGKVNSAIAAQKMIFEFETSRVLVCGTAGAMSKELKVFDTVICEETMYWDFRNNNLKEESPFMKEAVFKGDKKVIEGAKELKNLFFGRIVSGDSFVDERNREKIYDKFKPMAVDMETASVAHSCYMNNIPFSAVRTITDTPDQGGLENCNINFKKASEIAAKVTVEIIKKLKEVQCQLPTT